MRQVTAVSPAERALDCLRQRAHELPGEWPLTLHMLEGHAPAFFAEQNLGPELERALDALASWPIALTIGLDPDDAMDLVDAWWLKRQRGRPVPALDLASANSYLDALHPSAPLYAWLMGELLGLPRPYVSQSPLHDLYWLTHRVLVTTDYLARPAKGFDELMERLEAVLPQVQAPELADIHGEVVFCLQSAGRDASAHAAAFARHQRPDGSFLDAHCTAVGLLVLAHRR